MRAWQVYVISRGQIKVANKRFNSLRNEYEITFEHNSIFEPSVDDSAPRMKYKFVGIAALDSVAPQSVIGASPPAPSHHVRSACRV